MNRKEIAPGVFLTQVDSGRFKRCLVVVHMVLPGRREAASRLALLPHVLERRCEKIPDPTALSRHLFNLYGAELSAESYVAGPHRVVSIAVSGLKNAYALEGEDLAAAYLDLLGEILFRPKLSGGMFEAEDVAIEKEKQADYLKSELNDKRGYCLRQARRRLYGDSVLGIESAGYLEEIEGINAQNLFRAYQGLLQEAQFEIAVCGIEGEKAAALLLRRLEEVQRQPAVLPDRMAVPAPEHFVQSSEAMDTAQGKLAIICTAGRAPGAREHAAMRLANAMLGALPTSRLFMNVREKQSLCYYCSSAFAPLRGTLTMDSGVNHADAGRAATAMLKELEDLQRQAASEEELAFAKKAIHNAFVASKDSPDSLVNWVFNETLRGESQSMEEAEALVRAVTAEEVRAALAAYRPAMQYTITPKEGA